MNFRHIARFTAIAFALCGVTAGHAANLTISCGSNAANVASCTKFAEEWGKKTGNTISLYQAPASTTEALALLRQQFAAKASELDVIMVDLVWPGTIKDHLVDLKKYSKGAEGKYFPAIIANNTVGGKLLAIPWYANVGLLYYRKDLLEKYNVTPPETWADLAATAKKIQDGQRAAGAKDFQGFVFQGKAYEGLSCNALEWVASFGGGEIVDASGNITINNDKAAQALDTAASWVGAITPPGILNYAEEESRGVFQKGEAVFMRNWAYAWALAQAADSPIKGKIGVTALPAGPGGKKVAALGGWQLAVSKYSKNVDLAADLALYLTSREVQKKRAIEGSYNPTIMDLYQDKDVLTANPFMAKLTDILNGAVARPSTVAGAKYPEVSNAFWDATYDVLAKKTSGADAVKKLEGRLKQIKRNQW